MRSMQVMYYDLDILQAAGFDKPPETWDEFMQICAAASNPPDTYCYELNPDASTFAYWVFSRSGTLVSPDAKTIAFNSQAGIDSLDLIATLLQRNEAFLIAKAYQDQTDFALPRSPSPLAPPPACPIMTRPSSRQAQRPTGTSRQRLIVPRTRSLSCMVPA
jgi:hypothetical protein